MSGVSCGLDWPRTELLSMTCVLFLRTPCAALACNVCAGAVIPLTNTVVTERGPARDVGWPPRGEPGSRGVVGGWK